jgi:redox-sensing transcriptional repressor
MKKKEGVPPPTAERLPRYYRDLMNRQEIGQATVSSEEIGLSLDIEPAQVRKDLSYIWGKGRPGVGYRTHDLLNRLGFLLGASSGHRVALVGLGKLGSALADYSGFSDYGLDIVGLFDRDSNKIGTMMDGKTIMPVSELGRFIDENRIDMGIIAVSADSAQRIADELIAHGVVAIWNFAPIVLRSRPGVLVRNEDLAADLAVLSYRLQNEKIKKQDQGGY